MSIVQYIISSLALLGGLWNLNRYLRRYMASKQKNISLQFYSINQGNQDRIIIAPDYQKEWFDDLDKKYSWDNFDLYDNRLSQYMYHLIDTLPALALEEKISDIDFFNQLTRAQKVVFTFHLFNGETNNGGVYQFLFNRPQYYFAALETLKELNLDQLFQDYEKCMDELMGTVKNYIRRKDIFHNNPDMEKKLKAFCEGYIDVPSAEIIQEYYYKKEYKKQIYQQVVEFIDQHLDQFVKR